MLTFIDNTLKFALLELQEYVRLQVATFRGAVSRPFYFHDIVEQFEQIGIGSLTVVLLTGFFTGAVLALQTGITLDQFGARPFVGRLVSASMIKSWARCSPDSCSPGGLVRGLPPSSAPWW